MLSFVSSINAGRQPHPRRNALHRPVDLRLSLTGIWKFEYLKLTGFKPNPFTAVAAMKVTTRSRAIEDQTNAERQRDVLVLILSHLQSSGYIQTATTLLNEVQSADTLARYELADNMDLMQVVREYEEYHRMKFGRRPVFCRGARPRNPNPNGTDVADDVVSGSSRQRARIRHGSNAHGRQHFRDRGESEIHWARRFIRIKCRQFI